MNWANWKYDGLNNVSCSCSTCWPIFNRPLKWAWIPVMWISEAGTKSRGLSGRIR